MNSAYSIPQGTETDQTKKFRHVLCAYPYRRDLGKMSFFPPLGLEYIAATVEPFTQALDIVDMRQETGHTKDFLRPETDLVCFSVNWDSDIEFLCEEIRSVGSEITVVLGGRHATEDPERWLSEFPNVNMVVRGDGEEAMEEICRGLPLEKITGLSFRQNGRIVHNPNRTTGSVKDNLYPNRHRRRYSYEINFEGVTTGLTIDTLSSSRGCPYNCTFCSFSRNPWGEKRGWSARSPESVVEELAQVEAPIVGFTDDLFTLKMDRVERICDLIIARKIHKKFLINARLEIAKHPDVLRKMEKAGFVFLMLGIESTCDRTLRSMGKGFDTQRIREYCSVLRHSSMVLHGYFILGNIGESVEEMLQISTFAHELGLDTIAISTLRASPHSGLEELVANNPGYKIAHDGKVYSDQCSGKELRRLRRRIHKEFYSTRQVFKLLRKGIANGALRLLPSVLLRSPKIVRILLKRRGKHSGKV
ncbi:B12-binding domain-containing radical SAM protein [Planctomycetota bacterium]